MIFARYFALRFAKSFLITMLLLGLILALIDTAEQLRRFSNEGILFTTALRIALMNTPYALYQVLPIVVNIAALTLILAMSRSSELVAMRAAGRSGLRALMGPAMVAMVIGVVGLAVINPFVAATQKEYKRLRAEAGNQPQDSLLIERGELWLRGGDAAFQTIIRAKHVAPAQHRLDDVTFISLAPDGTLSARIEAKSAQLISGAWRLTEAKKWDFSRLNPEGSATILPNDTLLPSRLSWEGILGSVSGPSEISFWKLSGYIQDLERSGLTATAHRVAQQIELAQPLLLAAMVMLAAGLTMRYNRAQSRAMPVLMAILGGFGIFFMRNFAQVLGQSAQIPVFAAAWAPPLTAALLGLAVMLHVEES